jgi:hypothetical protein
MHLGEVKVVDLKHTEWDKTLSDPEHGKYVWKGPKTYIYQDNRTYGDPGIRPPHVLRWVATDEDDPAMDNREMYKWDYQAEAVCWKDNLYYPEPLRPDVNGEYKFKDMLLMQIPVEIWVEKMVKDQKRSNEAVRGERAAFASATRAEGAETPDANFYESGDEKKPGV